MGSGAAVAGLTPAQAVEVIWAEQVVREQRTLAVADPGEITALARQQTETVLLTLARFCKLTGIVVKIPGGVIGGPADDRG